MVAKNFKFLYRYYKDKQEVLAQMLHVPQSNISAYINGKKPIPIGQCDWAEGFVKTSAEEEI